MRIMATAIVQTVALLLLIAAIGIYAKPADFNPDARCPAQCSDPLCPGHTRGLLQDSASDVEGE